MYSNSWNTFWFKNTNEELGKIWRGVVGKSLSIVDSVATQHFIDS